MANVIYIVTVRGEIPPGLAEKVSQAHARAITGIGDPARGRGDGTTVKKTQTGQEQAGAEAEPGAPGVDPVAEKLTDLWQSS